MSIQGTPDGHTVRTGHSVADVTAGMFAIIGSLMALEARHRTGKGQFIDVAMQDTLMSTMAPSFAYFLGNGILPRPMGTRFAAIVPYRNFECADREISLAVSSDKLWKGFCKAIERPDLIHHPKFNSNPHRVVNRDELEPMLEAIFRSKPAAHWIEALTREGTPCTLVRNLKEVVEDEQTEAREMMPVVDHATAGKLKVTGPPIKLSENPGRVTTGASPLGADTAAVLRDVLGATDEEVERLEATGVIRGRLE
jgi:crotonobetainyl-CoA:carnitine CoA-transferase CaiB-like acyl-CoA transferase